MCVDQTEGPARGQPVQPDPGQADRHPGTLNSLSVQCNAGVYILASQKKNSPPPL